MATKVLKAEDELSVGFYLRNGPRMYEVEELAVSAVYLRNIVTEIALWWPRNDIRGWEVIFPPCQDTPDSLEGDG